MLIFKQSRYIALLFGVILVCFSAIVLLNPGVVTEGQQDQIQMVKLQSSGLSGNLSVSLQDAHQERTKNSVLTKLVPVTASFTSTWTVNRSKLAYALPLKATTVTPPHAKRIQIISKKVTASQAYPPTTLFFSRTELLSQEQQGKATWQYAVSEEDMLLLQKVVMAEAEGEPYQGKVAVANVVLNRLRSANFPNTIKKVIYQKSQFSPVANGRLKRVKPNKDSINAVSAALSGVKQVSDDTYFFLSLKLAQDLTVRNTRKYAKTIGNHTFYK